VEKYFQILVIFKELEGKLKHILNAEFPEKIFFGNDLLQEMKRLKFKFKKYQQTNLSKQAQIWFGRKHISTIVQHKSVEWRSPNESLPGRSHKLRINNSSFETRLKKDLNFQPNYGIQIR